MLTTIIKFAVKVAVELLLPDCLECVLQAETLAQAVNCVAPLAAVLAAGGKVKKARRKAGRRR